MHERANLLESKKEISVDEFIDVSDVWALLPLPFPDRPTWKKLTSCTLRARQKRRFQAWRRVCSVVRVINGLDSGGVSTKLTSSGNGGLVKATIARNLSLRSLFVAGADFGRVRRSLGLTGVHSATASLLKTPLDDWGYLKQSTVKQVPMIADRIKEPTDFASIDMLEALPAEDAEYYSCEQHVVEKEGKCEQLFREIEERYSFIGGTKEEYLKYLHREDVQHLWQWDIMDNIKATAGVSTVLKKNQHDQRKLIMQCAANYVFADPRDRADLGMGGGGALCRLRIPSNEMSASACDEDTAFTYVRVPDWMMAWQAGPPVRAEEVMKLLPASVTRELNSPYDFVAPKYVRLAMGGSHSVYILMRINLHHIGQSLFNYGSRLCLGDQGRPQESAVETPHLIEDEESAQLSDEDWVKRQEWRRCETIGGSDFTVNGWCEHVRRLKHLNSRTMVVMHFFCGDRRSGDIEFWVEKLKGHLEVSMISIDLANDSNWDFANSHTFHTIMQLVEGGLIDLVLGGPPCSTIARSRHVPLAHGPRPLRFRWCIWGREDLTYFERLRVIEANTLWVNYMCVCENVAARGGAWLWEHPADPGTTPYASIWATAEMQGLEERTGSKRALLHQCPFGGPVPKLTCFAGTIDGLDELDGIRCPGQSSSHVHGPSIGRDPAGGFHTRRLQSYPSDLCRELAERIVRTLQRMWLQFAGPTGALTTGAILPRPRVTTWSSQGNGGRGGITLLNEAVAKRFTCEVSCNQSAAYIHVDDTVIISDAKSVALHSDSILDVVVGDLKKVGFQVSQIDRNADVEKVVGYEVRRKPAQFRLPGKKMCLLRESLFELANAKTVDISILRTIVGMWVFGALLKRDLLAIPHSLFHFMEEFEGQRVSWWESARQEVRAMAAVTMLMYCELGAKCIPWCFATDAMGSNEIDAGGWGMAVTQLTESEIRTIFQQGEAPGLSVARLGEIGGTKWPDRPIVPTVPFTLLPSQLFDEQRWRDLGHGRWRQADHITLGESRTVVKLLRRIASWPQLRGSWVVSLQDNKPTACSMTKGRSPSYALNRVLRQKAGACLAAGLRLYLPWVESCRQPADHLSRLC